MSECVYVCMCVGVGVGGCISECGFKLERTFKLRNSGKCTYCTPFVFRDGMLVRLGNEMGHNDDSYSSIAQIQRRGGTYDDLIMIS